MSQRYPGGVITKSPTAPTQTAATGVWTLEQVAENVKNSTWPPNGPYFVEDVFSTYLYTGNGSTQTINNGIDLSGKGGLVWIKSRSAINYNTLNDTARGAQKDLYTDFSGGTYPETANANGLTSFGSTGFSIGNYAPLNDNGATFVSWSFRKQPKFFDIVTYTGNGSNRTISHNLGSTPGCIIIKSRSSSSYSWAVYHRGLNASSGGSQNSYIFLNDTSAQSYGTDYWNSTNPTSTQFSLGSNGSVNANGETYVAYLFAHDAGGFGTSGNDSIISCGSYTGNGSATGPEINLGWEPQWVMIKRSASVSTGNWFMFDNMRGLTVDQDLYVYANNAAAEFSPSQFIDPTSTGFNVAASQSSINANGDTYIYIAIRRGPMKTPTDATKVYNAVARSGTSANATINSLSFPPDVLLCGERGTVGYGNNIWDRLRGAGRYLRAHLQSAEASDSTTVSSFNMSGVSLGTAGLSNSSSSTYINWFFRRAPGFMDTVCYTGTGANRTVNHSLGVAPEMMIIRPRNRAATDWAVMHTGLATTSGEYLVLNSSAAKGTSSGIFNSTLPTSSVFTVGVNWETNGDTSTNYVAYLFASCPGVSKVGSYTGNGSSQTINCGFAAGARFVLIKRADLSGDWYVFDTVRGIVTGNDPWINLNTSSGEFTGYDAIDPDNTGFIVNQSTSYPINVNGGTYVYLAIA